MEEKKKRTGNATTTSEVELQPKTRGRKVNRNSWIDIYNENTALRKHKMLLGQEVQIDDSLEWRVKWGQRGAGTSCLLAVICYIAAQNIIFVVFSALICIFLGILYYKNVSFVIMKRLLRETNVVIIMLLSLCNVAIDVARPAYLLSPINGMFNVLAVSAFVLLDAIKVKSRVFVLVLAVLFVLVISINIYGRTFGDWDQGVVLFKYMIQGNEYTFMKRSTKRSIFIQIVLFSMVGIYALFKDKKQELIIFATGNIYRETGIASKEVKDNQYLMKIKSQNRIFSKKEELEILQINDKQVSGRSTVEVELKDRETSKASRNSWSDIYNENTTLHKHKMLLGQEVQTDDGLEWRVKWAQRAMVVFFLLTLICMIAGQWFAAAVFGTLCFISSGILYYKNFSFMIAKRLWREPNVVIILVLALCNWSIDIARPATSVSPILGFIYMLAVSAFVFLDAVKVKSRMFVIAIGIMFVLLNISNIYDRTFRGWDEGVVLLKYTIQGNKYTFMKRSTRRYIYLQIMLFSMNAIYTLFKDKKMELMIFATGNIYRETGTASNEVEQKSFTRKIESENRERGRNIERIV